MNVPDLSEPNQSELDWLAAHVALAAKLTGGEEGQQSAPGIDELDALWSSWLPDAAPEQVNDMVNIIGLAFGQRLVDDLGMRWVVATDAHGTEIAVHHATGDALMYPPNLVAKRWESRETGFLRPIYDDLAARLPQMRG